MLQESTLELLKAMKLTAMANEFRRQIEDPATYASLGFEDRLSLLTDAECHTSNYLSHLRQLYRMLNSASPSYRLYQRAVFCSTFLSALLTFLSLSHIVLL